MKPEKLYLIYNAVFCDLLHDTFGEEEFKEYVLNKVNSSIARIDHKIKADEFDSLFYGSYLKFERELYILEAIYKYYTRNYTTFQLLVYVIEVMFKNCNYLSNEDLIKLTNCNKKEIEKAYKSLGYDSKVA